MTLHEARAVDLRLRLVRPLVTATGATAVREVVIVRLCDGEGACGYGEAAPWPGFGTGTLAQAREGISRALEQLQGRNAPADAWTLELAPEFAGAPVVRAAVEGALCDLAARRAGQSLAAYLQAQAGGGEAMATVAVNVLLQEREPEALLAEASRARAAGYRAAKLKVGTGPLVGDLARVRAVRDGLGPAPALRLDANGAWNEIQAREALVALRPFALEYVEQPVPARDLQTLARLRAECGVRIAVDESLAEPEGLARVLDAAAADVVVLKPSLLGGPLAALSAARLARAAGCEVVFTHAFESAIGRSHALHTAAACGDAGGVHGLSGGTPFADDLASLPPVEAGAVACPPGPGLGLVFDPARLAQAFGS